MCVGVGVGGGGMAYSITFGRTYNCTSCPSVPYVKTKNGSRPISYEKISVLDSFLYTGI